MSSDTKPDVPAEVWGVMMDGLGQVVELHTTQDSANEAMGRLRKVHLKRYPVHGAAETRRDCAHSGLGHTPDPDCAECDKPGQWEALHAALEECHDALERKQGELDRAGRCWNGIAIDYDGLRARLSRLAKANAKLIRERDAAVAELATLLQRMADE